MHRRCENRVSRRATAPWFSVVVALCAIVLQSCESAPPTENGEIHRISVSSSAIQSVGYSESQKVLEVEFTAGEVYRYSGVPLDVFDGLMNAESLGSYFHEHIRDSGYEYKRVL